jgi:lipoprotein-anchoring transpeptidase ErfK/SrfK
MEEGARSGPRARRWLVAGGVLVLALVVGFGFAVVLPGALGGPSRTGAGGLEGACANDALVGTVSAASVVARARPSPTAPAVGTFRRKTPFGTPQVFLLAAEVSGTDGSSWFRALLPEAPNGSSGFIPGGSVSLSTSPFRLVVDRAARRMTVFRRCERLAEYPVAVGKPSTPTPLGEFYLTGLFRPPGGSALGPFAYSLSAHSEVLTWWRYGGIVGLHGTDDPSSIGRPVTHGCIRLRNDDIERLVKLVPVGTPIEVH